MPRRGPDLSDDHATLAPRPHPALGTLRDARARLSAAARSGADDALEPALAAFVAASWEAGFSYVTTWSIVAAALEEGLPGRRGRARRAHAAAWEGRTRALYAALARGRDHAGRVPAGPPNELTDAPPHDATRA